MGLFRRKPAPVAAPAAKRAKVNIAALLEAADAAQTVLSRDGATVRTLRQLAECFTDDGAAVPGPHNVSIVELDAAIAELTDTRDGPAALDGKLLRAVRRARSALLEAQRSAAAATPAQQQPVSLALLALVAHALDRARRRDGYSDGTVAAQLERLADELSGAEAAAAAELLAMVNELERRDTAAAERRRPVGASQPWQTF